MNGAENLLQTLEQAGIEVCFANPGTSEMHLVAAIGRSERVRPVLCLFEGVASGAADGYARMTDKPALTLLHLGSGYANSMANQHNAKRAGVPLVNMVGDHATWHLQYDAPLTSDIVAHAAISSDWVRASDSADDLALAGAQAVQASMRGSGKVATFIAPANHAWEQASTTKPPLAGSGLETVASPVIETVAASLLTTKRTVLFLGGRALREDSLRAAGRIARATGARLVCEVFPARLQRGAGRVAVERLPYFAEAAMEFLQGTEQIILVGARAPVAFFAYPGKPSWLAPEGCSVDTLATPDQDAQAALEAVAEQLDAQTEQEPVAAVSDPPRPSGELSPVAIGQSLTRSLPPGTVIVDEAATCGLGIFPATLQAPPHDWLTLTGGAIGIGLPLALGASMACPDRKVLALQADGSAMYTLQALWTIAREQSDVVIVIMNNRSYAILNIELARVGAGEPNARTLSMLSLGHPDLDFVDMASGMGVPASRAHTAEEFDAQLAEALASRGPRLIEAMVVQRMP